MGRFHGFGFELAKFFGKKGLDFLFTEAEMHGLGHELLQRRANLAAAGIDPQCGRLMRDVGAKTAFRFDEAFPLQNLIDLGDRERIDSQLSGEVAHRGKLLSMEELARENALLNLHLQLHVEWDSAVGVQEIHGVLLH